MNVGNVVQVKAKDGPKMTVNKVFDVNGVSTAECVWFEGCDLHKDTITVAALEAVNPE
ncbi:hypothetical protein LCGC14_0973860 [marine sediment metagenome]|uniref:DUF2158 domain-containing protein n=1 Tax=marine sediment metagenome TaxID=412755 RepID=A0A0F9NWY4_9ZZZZ